MKFYSKASFFLALAASPLLALAATGVSVPVGALSTTISPGTQIVGMPLLNPVSLSATVATNTSSVITLAGAGLNAGAVLSATKNYFAEINGGSVAAFVGDWVQVDVSATIASANATITIVPNSRLSSLPSLPVAPSLAGATIVLRPYVTIGQLFGTKGNTPMFGSTIASAADQVQLYNSTSQSFEIYYLLKNSSGSVVQWTKVGGGSTNQDGLPIAPGMGLVVVRNGSGSVTLPWVGEVRTTQFVQPLLAGNNCISQPFPAEQTPVQRNLTSAYFWTGSTISSSADQVQIYNQTSQSFVIYYLLRNPSGTIEQWTKVGGGSTNYNNSPLFTAAGGYFIRKISADPNYIVPCPYTL